MINNYTFADLVKESLTEREIEVLQLLANTFSKKEISNILIISTNTVDSHLEKISQKIKTDWTPSTTTKIQRLGKVWDIYKEEITKISGVALKTLDELLKEKGFKK